MMPSFEGACSRGGFSHQVADAVDATTEDGVGGLERHDAVARDALVRHALDGDDRPLDPVVDVDHLLQRWRIRVHHVIGQDHGERLVADHGLGHQHSVPEAERLALAERDDAGQPRDPAHFLKRVGLFPVGEDRLEIGHRVEVVLDGALAAAGDEDDALDPRTCGFLDGVTG